MSPQTAPEKKRGPTLFVPGSEKPFQLSRYRIERFMGCARCFWLELRRGLKRPEPHPYTLNNAVDLLVKREFDLCRTRGEPHPIMTRFGIKGVPFNHPELHNWQLATKGKGMRFLHTETNLDIMGSPDDIWRVDESTGLHLSVVDTKATSAKETHPIEDDWWKSYRRQIDIYVWLLKRQVPGYPVSRTGYFLLLNGDMMRPAFNWQLEFEPTIVTYQSDDSWVEPAICRAHACLMSDVCPPYADGCELCTYRRTAAKLETADAI